MKNVGDRSLLVGAALIALILAALMWFVAINPKLASAQTTKEATDAQRVTNNDLANTLVQRKIDAENVPDYTRELYAIRESMPPIEDIPSVRSKVNEIVTSQGLVVELDNVGEPQPILGGLSLQTQMEAVGLTSEIEGMAFTTLLATPFSFEVVGPPAQVFAIMDALQTADGRYFGITSFTITPAESDIPNSVRGSFSFFFYTLDYNTPGITVRPPERPWPGTEEDVGGETAESPFDPDTGPGEG